MEWDGTIFGTTEDRDGGLITAAWGGRVGSMGACCALWRGGDATGGVTARDDAAASGCEAE